MNLTCKPAIGILLPSVTWQNRMGGEVADFPRNTYAAQGMHGQAEGLLHQGMAEYKAITGTLGIIMLTFRSSITTLFLHRYVALPYSFCLSFELCKSLVPLLALVFFSQHCKSGISPGSTMEDWSQRKKSQLQYIFDSCMFLLCSRNKVQSAYS